jgi:hypothetical protein
MCIQQYISPRTKLYFIIILYILLPVTWRKTTAWGEYCQAVSLKNCMHLAPYGQNLFLANSLQVWNFKMKTKKKLIILFGPKASTCTTLPHCSATLLSLPQTCAHLLKLKKTNKNRVWLGGWLKASSIYHSQQDLL